ncbi:pentapeptide repeat-containing protein [Streptomyces microflavus]|uniref:pentapeptide repeat-containing protein n=1 Tax=Streptomyces microflavus TaxID=1919 RepID=UPI0037FDB852
MTSTLTPTVPTRPPSWPHCAQGSDPTGDLIGCRGRQVEPFNACLTHLAPAELSLYLDTLAPGSDIFHDGTEISDILLQQLLEALGDPHTGRARIGVAQFEEATFTGEACFDGVAFAGDALFKRAEFCADAVFEGVDFHGKGMFCEAKFNGDAAFEGAAFAGEANFVRVKFTGISWFSHAGFAGAGEFSESTFSSRVMFDRAMFTYAEFVDVSFEMASELGPFVSTSFLDLSGARFGAPVTVEVATARLQCRRTRWDSTAALRLRYATVDLSDAVFEYPLSISSRERPLSNYMGPLSDGSLAGRNPRVRMESLRGVDAAHLVLHEVDMRACLLSGTVHLDQLRMEGECALALAPSGIRRQGMLPMRWTARRTLAEEQHWRHEQGRSGWTAGPAGAERVGPAQLAPLYRQLRKSFEDSKNEPDAADFYYGEMEMRRHDRGRPGAERALLAVYWAVSGYGLRASRAIGWLVGAMAATILIMMLWGLPQSEPKSGTTGSLTGQSIVLVTDKPAPRNPSGSLGSRLSSDRWEKSLRVVVNSGVFRSSGQDLTTAGTYTEMVSRLAEPLLLGLATLAVRGRVKR